MHATAKTGFDSGLEPSWQALGEVARTDVVLRLMDSVEVSPRAQRMQAARAVLYLLQGTFGECTTLHEAPQRARQNVFLLYRHGFFHIFLQLLNMEIEWVAVHRCGARNCTNNSFSLNGSDTLCLHHSTQNDLVNRAEEKRYGNIVTIF